MTSAYRIPSVHVVGGVGVSKGLQLRVIGVTGSVTRTVLHEVSTHPIPDRRIMIASLTENQKRATTCMP
jgi:hypothetical protein